MNTTLTSDAGCASALHRTSIALLCALTVILLLRAQPIWTIGFYQDDAVMSSWRQDGALNGLSIYGYCYGLVKGMFLHQGRLAPVGLLTVLPLQMLIEDNLLLYRLAQGAAQVLALASFVMFVRALSRSTAFALASAVAFAGIFEIRNYHDTAFSYFLLYPFIIATGSLSCYYAVRSSERTSRASWREFWPILALNAVGILTYEMAVPFCALSSLILLLNGPHPRRDRVLRALVAGLPVALVVGIGIVAKAKMSVYEGTAIGVFDPGILAATYFKQLGAALPLSYWMLDPHQMFERMLRDPRLFPQSALAAAGIFALVTWALAVALWHAHIRQSWLLWASAATLLLVPPALISVSAKYQKETVAGVGYLQTVISYLGLGLALTLAATFVIERLRSVRPGFARVATTLVSTAAGAVAAVALLASYRVAATINESWRFPREVSDVWMKASTPPAGGRELIVLDRDWLHRWENPAYLHQQRGTRGAIISRDQYAGRNAAAGGPPPTFLRLPDIPHPDEVSLVLEVTPTDPGRMVVRGYAISASKQNLRHAPVVLRRGEARWQMDGMIYFGRHGYYYRTMELPADSANPAEFLLESR